MRSAPSACAASRKVLELDLAVAQHVGVRRAAGGVFGEEMLRTRRSSTRARSRGSGSGCRAGRTRATASRRSSSARQSPLPSSAQFCMKRPAIGSPCVAQQQRGDRRIDAAGHADDGAQLRSRVRLSSPHANCCTIDNGWRRPARWSPTTRHTSGLRWRACAAWSSAGVIHSARSMPVSSGRAGSCRTGSAANAKRR